LYTLQRYHYDEDLAISKVRKKFPSLTNPNSLDYAKKLAKWRKKKIKNLSKKINKDIVGEIIADVGGRSDDFLKK
jgi:hypothetical protein